jgi:hypothetical protein
VSKLIRPIAALSAVFFVAVGLLACGGSGVSGNSVASVNGQQITQDAYNHWLSVAAASSAAALPGQKAAAKPAVPVPPAYTACIAHLKAIEPKPAKGQKPKTEALLSRSSANSSTRRCSSRCWAS